MADLFATSSAFRSARDSWWSSRMSAKSDAFSDGAKVAARAKRKEERWKLYGRSYMRHYATLSGGLIRFPPELAAMVERQIESIAPRMARAFDKHLGKLAQDAWDNWPVGTGLSRSLLDIEYEQRGETFIGRVISRAPYTTFIKSGGSSPYQELLKKPGAGVAKLIVDELAKDKGDARVL